MSDDLLDVMPDTVVDARAREIVLALVAGEWVSWDETLATAAHRFSYRRGKWLDMLAVARREMLLLGELEQRRVERPHPRHCYLRFEEQVRLTAAGLATKVRIAGVSA